MSAAHLHHAGRQPFEQDLLRHATLWIGREQLRNRTHPIDKRQSDAANAQNTDPGFWEPLAEKEHQRRGGQRKQWNQPQVIEKVAYGIHLSLVLSLILSRAALPLQQIH